MELGWKACLPGSPRGKAARVHRQLDHVGHPRPCKNDLGRRREQAAVEALLPGFHAVCGVSSSSDRSSASGCKNPSRVTWKNGSATVASPRFFEAAKTASRNGASEQ